MTKDTKDYSKMRSRLDEILAKLETGEISDIDEMTKLYKEASDLIDSLQKVVEKAKNSIKKSI
jgi:exodeoxyribonuclease VII small subunit